MEKKMTEDEIKAEMNVYNKIIADNYAQYCETPKDNGRTDTLIQALDKIERLEKQLRIALAAFRMIRYSHNTIKDRKTGEIYYTWHYAEMKIKGLEK